MVWRVEEDQEGILYAWLDVCLIDIDVNIVDVFDVVRVVHILKIINLPVFILTDTEDYVLIKNEDPLRIIFTTLLHRSHYATKNTLKDITTSSKIAG